MQATMRPDTASMAASDQTTMAASVSQLERHGFLFGQKITHSWSPYLHQTIYEELGLNWAQLRLDSADMAQFLELVQHPSFYGEQFCHPYSITVAEADMMAFE
jgi:quinate dehydrogenase